MSDGKILRATWYGLSDLRLLVKWNGYVKTAELLE